MINVETVWAALVGTVFGGSGLVGLLFVFLRRFIDKRLEDRELEHATGRLLFYLHKAIVTGQHNGDLAAAWQSYQDSEQRKKALDREILVENEMDN